MIQLVASARCLCLLFMFTKEDMQYCVFIILANFQIWTAHDLVTPICFIETLYTRTFLVMSGGQFRFNFSESVKKWPLTRFTSKSAKFKTEENKRQHHLKVLLNSFNLNGHTPCMVSSIDIKVTTVSQGLTLGVKGLKHV